LSTILCVEDEPLTGLDLERALSGLGHRAVMTASIEEARAAVNRQPLDLILANDWLPDASGLDLLRALQQQGREIPVIIMTHYSSVEEAVTSIRHGAADYLTKPLRLEALRLAVNNAIALARLRLENAEYRRQLNLRRVPAPNALPVRDLDVPPGEIFDLRELERIAIRRALVATNGNRTRAARLLGMSERTLRKKLNTGFLDAR
jgi:DNA-binding NtrC family response regulator